MELLQELSNSLVRGDADATAEGTRAALEGGLEPKAVLDGGLLAGMAVIGERFKAHEIFLPDVLLAAKAMNAGMQLLKPLLIADQIPTLGKVVIGSVQGDLHDIGKNLVGIMLKGAGFEVIDLGSDVSPACFVDAAQSEGAAVIGLSALLTTTMPVMREVVKLAESRGVRERVRIIVGGAPLSHDYAREIGADAYGFDGLNAVERVKQLLGVSP